MDEQTKKNLRENQFKARGNSYYTEGRWLKSGERESFLWLKSQITEKCRSLEKQEKNFNTMLKEIGDLGLDIQKLIRNHNLGMPNGKKVSIKKVFAKNFGKGANRVYEAIAYHRAIKAGLPENLPKITLIKFGEALGNKKIRHIVEEKIEGNHVSIEGVEKEIKDLSHQDVVKLLSNIRKPKKQEADDFFLAILSSVKKAQNEAINLRKFIKNLEVKITKNQLMIKSDEIRDAIESLESGLTAIEQDNASSKRPNSVSTKADDAYWEEETQSSSLQ